MIAAFRERRPWVTVLVGLLFSPVIGMSYLGRGWLAIAYLLLGLVCVATVTWLALTSVLPLGPDNAETLALLAVNVVGAVQGYRIAARRDPGPPARWYSRWYALIAIGLAPLVLAAAVRTLAM
jgi:hypothetical protein